MSKMNKEIHVLVVGPSGSGKTTIAKILRDRLYALGFGGAVKFEAAADEHDRDGPWDYRKIKSCVDHGLKVVIKEKYVHRVSDEAPVHEIGITEGVKEQAINTVLDLSVYQKDVLASILYNHQLTKEVFRLRDYQLEVLSDLVGSTVHPMRAGNVAFMAKSALEAWNGEKAAVRGSTDSNFALCFAQLVEAITGEPTKPETQPSYAEDKPTDKFHDANTWQPPSISTPPSVPKTDIKVSGCTFESEVKNDEPKAPPLENKAVTPSVESIQQLKSDFDDELKKMAPAEVKYLNDLADRGQRSEIVQADEAKLKFKSDDQKGLGFDQSTTPFKDGHFLLQGNIGVDNCYMLLLHADVDPPKNEMTKWTQDQLNEAAEWALADRKADAEFNSPRQPKPEFLAAYGPPVYSGFCVVYRVLSSAPDAVKQAGDTYLRVTGQGRHRNAEKNKVLSEATVFPDPQSALQSAGAYLIRPSPNHEDAKVCPVTQTVGKIEECKRSDP